jgi:hypothetical protein
MATVHQNLRAHLSSTRRVLTDDHRLSLTGHLPATAADRLRATVFHPTGASRTTIGMATEFCRRTNCRGTSFTVPTPMATSN